MELTENKIFEALGVEPEKADAGVKEREAAEPAQADAENSEGANEQEIAEPAAQLDTLTDADEQGEGGEADDADNTTGAEGASADGAEMPEKPALTPEQRRENAALRRRQERQAAIDEAVKNAVGAEQERVQTELADFFKNTGMTNTITGQPITTLEEWRAWQREHEAAKLQSELKAGKLTPEHIEKAVAELPAIKAVQDLVRRQEEERKQQEIVAAQARVEAEIAEIQKLDPQIRGIDDLMKMPNSKEFYEHVKRGNSFVDAFYLANRERLQQQAAQAAKQQALSNTRSKEHLTATGARGAGAVSVPPGEMEMFRVLMPGASEAEIQAYYQKTKKP